MTVLLTKLTQIMTDYGNRNVYDFLNKAYSKYYSPSECLAVVEVFQKKGKFQTVHE
jgi:hypothetical protein